jgi:tetratricopeptide (TPR) repeat protein
MSEIPRLRELASKAFEVKDYRTAAMHYTSIIEIDPNDAQAYVGRGASAGMSKREVDAHLDYNTAIAVLTKKINAGERTPQNYGMRAIVYSNKQEYGASLADYNLAVQAGPTIAALYFDRARVLEYLGDAAQAKADRRKYSDLGGTNATPQPVRAMYPRGIFDIQAGKNAFARGNGSIEGIVCTNLRTGVYRASGSIVSLYPVTPYVEEWHKLREEKEGDGLGVFMSWEANYYRRDVTANEEGRFHFYDLKPGRYFIQTFHDFSTRHSANVFVGSDEDTDYYQTEDWTQRHSKRIEKFVDVKADGSVVKVTMKKGNPLSLRGCL